jgi:hypothetical protein
MTFWPIILIALAVVMAVGPVMMMQPTSRDRRLASLRLDAAQSGLHIRMADYEKDGHSKSVAVYTYQVSLPKNTPTWSLLRRSYQHEIHFHANWEWQSTNKQISHQKDDQLHKFLDSLPDDIVGLEVNEMMVGIWWLEKPSTMTIKTLKQLLQQLVTIAV